VVIKILGSLWYQFKQVEILLLTQLDHFAKLLGSPDLFITCQMIYFIFDYKALVFYETPTNIAQWIIKTNLFFHSRFIFDDVLIVEHAVLILELDGLRKVFFIILLKIIFFVIFIIGIGVLLLDLSLCYNLFLCGLISNSNGS
jgi:hypothetical protein